jgi:hypothetical protein
MEPLGAFWVKRRVDAGAGHADPELGPGARAAAVGPPAWYASSAAPNRTPFKSVIVIGLPV